MSIRTPVDNPFDLAPRMKLYEEASQLMLPRRLPLIIRVDGRAFSSLTASVAKPWDEEIREAMEGAASWLLADIQGAKFAYCQSDEISILATDYDRLDSEPWFGKNLQKIVSIAASRATLGFNNRLAATRIAQASFDARAFVLPHAEVCNYFLWRQRDCIRNSILGLAQANFSHKQIHGLNTSQLQEKLWYERGVNWNDCELWQKRGFCLRWEAVDGRIIIETPEFSKDREYVDRFVFLTEVSHGSHGVLAGGEAQ
jgi:tRNA(His) 5'-end guanylyltransferase